MSLLRTWRFWLGCIVSPLCLWVGFRSVPLGKLVHVVASANALFLLVGIASLLLTVVARAWRWLVVLDKNAGLADSFWAQGVGFLFTNVFPLRLGEPARCPLSIESSPTGYGPPPSASYSSPVVSFTSVQCKSDKVALGALFAPNMTLNLKVKELENTVHHVLAGGTVD